MSKIKREEIKKILCIKPRGIGDILLSTIVLDNLRAALPHCQIHYLTEEFAKRAVENNPFVSKILTFNKKNFVLSIIKMVRQENYDLIFDFWSNPKTAQVTFFSGAKYRVGYEKQGRKYAYNLLCKNGTMGEHAAEDNLVLLKALDIPIISRKIIYQTTIEEKQFAEKFLNEFINKDKLLIGIIPSGGWESKRCDPEKWIEICSEIQKKYKAQLIILWGPGDEKDAQLISEGFSLALLEAAASRLPIIASNIPGNDEFIEDKKNGLLFDLSKPNELAENILTLSNNRKLAFEYGSSAEESFINEYTLERYTEKLIKFFDEAYSIQNKTKTS